MVTRVHTIDWLWKAGRMWGRAKSLSSEDSCVQETLGNVLSDKVTGTM